MFFDSHAHYNDERFNIDRDELLNNMKKNQVTGIINVGYDIKSSKFSIELAKRYDFIYASIGIHPGEIPGDIEEIKNLAIDNKIVAIGEIGLDYHWNKENKDEQKEYFIKQIDLANELELPIIVHNRESDSDVVDIIKNKIICKKAGVMHCSSLDIELTKEVLKLGYYISFAGPITYKNSKVTKEVAKYVPLDRMLIETDSPYLTPEPNRGKRNDSTYVRYVAEEIAKLRNMQVEDIANITFENTRRIFDI